MPSLADLMYGTAQNAAQEQGAGLPQAVTQGADLAIKQQNLQLQQQDMQNKMQQLTMEKYSRVGQSWEAAGKMAPGSMRDAFVNNWIPKQTEAMGLQNAYDPTVSKMLSKEPQISAVLHAGVLSGKYDPGILAQPDKVAQIYPELQTLASAQDLSKVAGDQNTEFMKEYQDSLQRKSKESENQATRENTMAMRKMTVAAGAGKTDTQNMNQTLQLLESARGNAEVQQAQKDIYSAQKAKSLMGLYGDPNKLSPAQVQLLVSEVGKIAQGGNPSMHELDALTPNTLVSKFAGTWGKLSNDPTPANAAAFVKQYSDYTNALQKDAKAVVYDKYNRVLEAKKNKLTDDENTTLKKNYLDPVAPSAPSTINFMGHDWTPQQLQDTINKNPNSPNAVKAKAALAAAGV